MPTIWRFLAATLAAGAVASSATVNADSYRAKGLAFEISSISEGDLEHRIAAALIEPGIELLDKETHPVVQRWVTPPCIEIAERVPGTESTLLSIIATVHLRSNVRLPSCSLRSSGDIILREELGSEQISGIHSRGVNPVLETQI
jgi:hypothetical protein